MRDGYGVQRYADGSLYEGVWQYDKQIDGTMTWPDKSYYKGHFSGNFFQGEGTLITKEEIIRGTWKKSKLDGQGERIMLDGSSRYMGKWVQGKLTGHGEFHNQHENYVGHFFNNLEHGTGKKIYSDGTEYEGKWNQGLAEGFGKIVYPDGSYYRGQFLEGMKHGKGTHESNQFK